GDVDAPAQGYAAFLVAPRTNGAAPEPLLLSRFDDNGNIDSWSTIMTGADAFDFTGQFGTLSPALTPTKLYASPGELWIGATVTFEADGEGVSSGDAVARFDEAPGRIAGMWCEPALQEQAGCDQSLDTGSPAAVPDAVFATPNGEVALALEPNFVDVFSDGEWTRDAAPGYLPAQTPSFSGPSEGWLAGPVGVGHWTLHPRTSPLVSSPESNRPPLTSVALSPGSTAAVGEAGALAVGLGGAALHFDPAKGWLLDPLPPRASHINILSVAFASADTAFAVGQF